jgi:signal transduction histidine kinase
MNMKFQKHARPSRKRFFFSFSIQQRLPLLICILLFIVVMLFSITSYITMHNTSLQLGKERLNAVTQQFSSMFEQSTRALAIATRNFAKDDDVTEYVKSSGIRKREEALEVFNKIRQDTLSVLVEVLNADKQKIYATGKEQISGQVNLDHALSRAAVNAGYTYVGKIYLVGDSMYIPVVAAVTENKKPIGYIIRWRVISSTSKALEQLSQLLGTNATLYFGNNDSQFWTDLIKPVPAPPVDSLDFQKTMSYSRKNSMEVIASVKPIVQTEWLLLIEFSREAVLAGAKTFMYWVLGMGLLLIITGSFLAWKMSRNITRPLNQLTTAVSAISNGDYKVEIDVNRRDELGKLARAFSLMSMQVQNAQLYLEKKVQDRTAQLETANKELEAFSYSVSHDLRAPLRAVSGYAVMLKEDYEANLDAEGKRILNAIVSHAKMMGTLIDDLISFSRIAKKEVAHRPVDMKAIAESCVADLLQQNGNHTYQLKVADLPAAAGDDAMIKQVWLNLLENAFKYSSKKESPSIEVGYREEEYTNVYFIRDNGVGFDMQYAHKLFGVFQRLHSAEHFQGTGIGLALVHRIITKHGGEIWAQSVPDEGATFYFRLSKINIYE